MTYDEKRTAASKLHARAREMRGRFLNHVACLERDMALILTDYFCTPCPEKRKLFHDRIVTGSFFGLRRKRDVLYAIIKTDYPRYWMEYEKSFKAFDRIADFRNKLAHSVIDVSDEALARPLEEGVSFLDRDGCDPITDEHFNAMEVELNMLSTCIGDLKKLLPYKEKPMPNKAEQATPNGAPVL